VNRDRVNELWVRFLSGEELSVSEEQEVVDALREDPELRQRLLQDVQLDGSMRALGWSRGEEDLFTREFADGLAAERDGTSFVRRVELRVQKDDPSQGNSRGPAKSTRRLPQQRPGRAPWKLFGFAAAALFAIGLLAILFSGNPAGKEGHPDRTATRRKAAQEERARAEEARKIAEKRLQEIDREQATVIRPEEQPASDPHAEKNRKAALAHLAEERERVEQEMKGAIDRARKAREEVARTPDPPQEPAPRKADLPTPAPQPATETRVLLATVEQVEGEVYLLSEGQRIPAKVQDGILAGHGLETAGPRSRVIVAYPDKTRLEAGPETLVLSFAGRTEKEGIGKWIDLRKGTLGADVAKQPAGRPLVIATPHGEARVVGTTLRVYVDPGPKGATELEVKEGRVKLTRLDGRTVDVLSGHYAVAAAGMELMARTGVATFTLSEGLLGHWRFDETSGAMAIDSSGRGHDGKIVGATRSPGKIRGGLKFDGQNSHIACGPGPSFRGKGPFSVCAWIRTVSPADQVLFLQTTFTKGQYSLGVFAGKVQWSADPPSSGFKVVSDRSVNDAKWHHVLALRDKEGTGRIYIDGKPAGASPAVAPADMGGGNIYIGAEQCCTKWYFNGLLDDVRLYGRALSPEEIATLAGAAD